MATSSSMTTMRCFIEEGFTRRAARSSPPARQARVKARVAARKPPPAQRGLPPPRLRPAPAPHPRPPAPAPARAGGRDAAHLVAQPGDLVLERLALLADAGVHTADLRLEVGLQVIDPVVHGVHAAVQAVTHAGDLGRKQAGHQQEDRNEGPDDPLRVAADFDGFRFRPSHPGQCRYTGYRRLRAAGAPPRPGGRRLGRGGAARPRGAPPGRGRA